MNDCSASLPLTFYRRTRTRSLRPWIVLWPTWRAWARIADKADTSLPRSRLQPSDRLSDDENACNVSKTAKYRSWRYCWDEFLFKGRKTDESIPGFAGTWIQKVCAVKHRLRHGLTEIGIVPRLTSESMWKASGYIMPSRPPTSATHFRSHSQIACI